MTAWHRLIANGKTEPQKPTASATVKAVIDGFLAELERKVLWLSTFMIHNANHLRASEDGLKIGGHQASSPIPGPDALGPEKAVGGELPH